MSLLASTIPVIVAAAGDTGYTPAQLALDIAAAAPTVLAYAGAAVGAGLGVTLALVALKKGVAWARSMLAKG